MYQHKKNFCFLFLLSPALYVNPPGSLLYCCALPEHGLTIMEYISILITVKYGLIQFYSKSQKGIKEIMSPLVPECHCFRGSHLQEDDISVSLIVPLCHGLDLHAVKNQPANFHAQSNKCKGVSVEQSHSQLVILCFCN